MTRNHQARPDAGLGRVIPIGGLPPTDRDPSPLPGRNADGSLADRVDAADLTDMEFGPDEGWDPPEEPEDEDVPFVPWNPSMGPCEHFALLNVDSSNVLFESCYKCQERWTYGLVTPTQAEAVRRAVLWDGHVRWILGWPGACPCSRSHKARE